eukprot:gene2762-5445_t
MKLWFCSLNLFGGGGKCCLGMGCGCVYFDGFDVKKRLALLLGKCQIDVQPIITASSIPFRSTTPTLSPSGVDHISSVLWVEALRQTPITKGLQRLHGVTF